MSAQSQAECGSHTQAQARTQADPARGSHHDGTADRNSNANSTSARGSRGGARARNRDRNKTLPRAVRISKALSLVLRHKADSLGLAVRPDGYINLAAVLATQPLRSIRSVPPDPVTDPVTGAAGPVAVREIRAVIRDSDKQRFSLRYVRDDGTEVDVSASAGADAGPDGGPDQDGEVDAQSRRGPGAGEAEYDTADPARFLIRANQGHSIASVRSDGMLRPITLDEDPSPDQTPDPNCGPNAGPTLKLSPITPSCPGFPKVVVHGTTAPAWTDIFASGGLSRMKRRHVHFSVGLPDTGFELVRRRVGMEVGVGAGSGAQGEGAGERGEMEAGGDNDGVGDGEGDGEEYEQARPSSSSGRVISGIRPTSSVLIFVHLRRALRAGIPFWMSDNGVVLSEGDGRGVIPVEYFDVVVRRDGRVLFPESGAEGGEGGRGPGLGQRLEEGSV